LETVRECIQEEEAASGVIEEEEFRDVNTKELNNAMRIGGDEIPWFVAKGRTEARGCVRSDERAVNGHCRKSVIGAVDLYRPRRHIGEGIGESATTVDAPGRRTQTDSSAKPTNSSEMGRRSTSKTRRSPLNKLHLSVDRANKLPYERVIRN
jgi:hypothetical protein